MRLGGSLARRRAEGRVGAETGWIYRDPARGHPSGSARAPTAQTCL